MNINMTSLKKSLLLLTILSLSAVFMNAQTSESSAKFAPSHDSLKFSALKFPDFGKQLSAPVVWSVPAVPIVELPPVVYRLSTPLIILDGEIIPNEEMNKINPKNIESITVLKGAAAIELHGEKAANGVIIITSKTGAGEQNQQNPKEKESVPDIAAHG